ncbi:MAG: hypothetical protein HFE67_08940, partial [Erysipelotrichaceae bacterium]|nr:hypothetical protein [Erysipelotrichaceae bacterium]
MWKKVLLCGLTLLGVYSLNFMLFQDQMNAEGYIDGSPSNEAGTSLKLGDRVHLGGSAMSDDMHTVLGAKDGYLYLLRTNSANSGNLSNYNNALNYANTTYKTQLGTVGSAHFSLSGNAVSLISKAELQNLSLVSSDTLHASIPQISDKWWLSDANTSTNRASYMTKDNSFLGTNTITQTTVTNKTCTTSSASEIGILPINSETQEKVLKDSVLSSQSITVMMSIPYVKRQKYNGTNCTGSVIGTDTTFVGGDSTTQTFNYSYNGTKQTWSIANSGGANFSMFVTQGWRPMNVNDTKSVTLTVGSCYNTRENNSSLYVGSTTNELNYHSFKLLALNNNGYASAKVTGTSNQQYNRSYCDGQTTPAGSALVRPYLKVALNDVLMRNVTKRSYSANSTLSTTGFPASDNSGEYITLQTSALDVGLQNGASGVSGNRYEVKKPSSGTTITLPLSFSGPIEGNRYVSAEATDKDGNAVYGVLKAIGSATSDSVEIDFAKLLQDGGDSFQITLYLEDAGSKNTAYRSEGTEITVQFQKSTTSLSFTKPETTNIKLGSADVKETIATNNTEIATSGDNAVKYTLSGGISNTGLTIINDPIDPKGFTISIGAGTNSNLPADFTLTAELETTNSTKATATKQIHVFQEMSDFRWIPIKTGSLNTTEAESGKKMGDLEVKNGLPKFTYALTSPSDSGYDATKAKDNRYFTVDQEQKESNQTASVSANTSLSPGTYYIQCKVTDAYGDVLYTDFTITVDTKE